MGKKILISGNEAIGKGAILSGCKYYFGYPFNSDPGIFLYLSKELPKIGGSFTQAKSEIAAINMAYGAAAAGERVLTSASGPGISLKMEGISYLAGAELPCVIVNISRGGVGLSEVEPSQADYLQATKGGGHGDYKVIVLAPNSVQEMGDLTMKAFELADLYRNPVMLLADCITAQMLENIELKKYNEKEIPQKDWALTGANKRPKNLISSLYFDTQELEEQRWKLYEKYKKIEEQEVLYEEYLIEDAEIVVIAFGILSRIAKTAIDKSRKRGIKVGMLRPITLWPFPTSKIKELADKQIKFLVCELNTGQMVQDVDQAANGSKVYFYGRTGGGIPTPFDINNKIHIVKDA